MTTWPTSPLGAKVRFLSGGTPKKDEPRYWGGEIPWVSSAEMAKNHINDTELHVTEDGAKYGTRLVPAKTVLVVVRGMSLAKEFRVAITEREVTFNQDLKALLPSHDLDSTFLFYYLKSQNTAIRDSASEAAHGTKKLDMPVLEQWPLPLPPIPTQKKIAAILSAYDDLIEINRRRIVLLEKMAEEIYREWFVRMRFSEHEQMKFEKGFPKMWRIVELKTLAHEASKSARQGEHLSDRFYLPLDLLETKKMLPADHQDYIEAHSSLVTFEEGDILFGTMRPYLHKVAIAPFKGITRTTCFVIRPKDIKAYSYLYLTLFQQSTVDYASMIANGADRPYVVWNRGLERMKVLEPDNTTLEKFDQIVGPILQKIKRKYFIQRNLKHTRNVLLSRLISGKLTVENLDIQFPPSILREAESQEFEIANA